MMAESTVAVGDVGDIERKLAPYWYGFVVRGTVLFGFGLFFIFFPASTWTVFSTAFGIFCLVDGIINIGKASVTMCSIPDMESRCSMIFMFLLGAACDTYIGLSAIFYPAVTAEAMLIILSLWLIVIGAAQFGFGIIVGVSGTNPTMACCTGLIGILYVVSGTTFLFNLDASVGFFIVFVGLCMIMFGLQMMFLGLALKGAYTTRSGYVLVGETPSLVV